MLMLIVKYNRVDATHAHINRAFTCFVKGWVGEVSVEHEVFDTILGLLAGGVDGDLDAAVRVHCGLVLVQLVL